MKFSFLTIFLLSSQLWAAAWEQNVPLQSSEQKAEAFLRIRALIPSMADGAVRYGFDPVTLLDHQVQIEKMLAKDPTYLSLKSSHGKLMEFSIFDGAVPSTESSEKNLNWKAWQERSAQTVLSLGLTTPPLIKEEIQKTLGSSLLGKSQGIIVGLAQLLPAHLKKDFFSMPLDAKVDLLKQHLPPEIISQGFAPARLGWKDTEISREEIIDRLKSSVGIEQRLSILLVHHFSQQGAGALPKDYLTQWTLESAHKKTLEQWFNANVAKLIPTEQAAAPPSLVLREVPPVVAMFRGFAGNDCSTICSFPFVNSPNEYTFLIYDSKGGIKGYAQGTKVLVQGENAFYLHTIAGPRVSTVDTLNVIKTFMSQRKSMGFAEILLPPMEKIEGLINFIPVREAIKQVMSSSTEPITYQDSALRDQFKSAFRISKTYDDAASNPFGYRINESKLGDPVKVMTKILPGLDQIQTQMDRSSLIAMLLQMGKSYDKNKMMIDALAPHAGVSSADVRKLIQVAQNHEHLATQPLAEKMESTLRNLGFNFKEGYFKANISLIAHGLLLSPDILTKPALVDTVIQNLLEQREIAGPEKFLLKHPGYFKNSTLSAAFFRAFYNDIHEAQFQESSALREALRQNPKAILTNGELLTVLQKSAKAMEVLTTFVMDHSAWAQVIPRVAGRELLNARQEQVNLRDFFFKKLNSSKNEAEYDQRLSEMNLKMSAQGMSSNAVSRIKKDIYVSTMDLYTSFNPKNSVHTIFYNLLTQTRSGEDVQRALRKLLPMVLKSGSTYQLNSYLETAAQLKVQSGTPTAVDRIVREALMERSDRESLKSSLNKHFPDLKLDHSKSLRCEGLLL